MKELARKVLLALLERFGQIQILKKRAERFEIGINGNVDEIDLELAKMERLRPLTPVERWLIQPYIESQRKRRKELWQHRLSRLEKRREMHVEGPREDLRFRCLYLRKKPR